MKKSYIILSIIIILLIVSNVYLFVNALKFRDGYLFAAGKVIENTDKMNKAGIELIENSDNTISVQLKRKDVKLVNKVED